MAGRTTEWHRTGDYDNVHYTLEHGKRDLPCGVDRCIKADRIPTLSVLPARRMAQSLSILTVRDPAISASPACR